MSRRCERPSTRGPSTVTRHAGGLPRRGALAGLLRGLAGWLQNQGQGPRSSPAPSVCCLLSSGLLSLPSPWSPPCPRLALLWLLPYWPLCPCLPRLPGWVEPADGDGACEVLGGGCCGPCGADPGSLGAPALAPRLCPPSQLRSPLALAPQTLALPQAQSSRFCLCCKIPGAEIRSSRLPFRPPGL